MSRRTIELQGKSRSAFRHAQAERSENTQSRRLVADQQDQTSDVCSCGWITGREECPMCGAQKLQPGPAIIPESPGD